MMKSPLLPLQKTNIYRVRPIRVHFKLDTDRDGVPDHKDCQPFDSKRHQAMTQQQAIQNLQAKAQMYPERRAAYEHAIQKVQSMPRQSRPAVQPSQPQHQIQQPQIPQQQSSFQPVPAYTRGGYTYYYPPNILANTPIGKLFGWK